MHSTISLDSKPSLSCSSARLFSSTQISCLWMKLHQQVLPQAFVAFDREVVDLRVERTALQLFDSSSNLEFLSELLSRLVQLEALFVHFLVHLR